MTWAGRRALVVCAATLVAVTAGELGLRWLLPPSEGYYVLVPGTDRTFHPDPVNLPGISGPARYRVNAEGIRGRPFGEDGTEYRILAIGGSTTENAYLDEGESWPGRLERELDRTADGRRVWVGNVGRSGRTGRDHAVQLKYLLAHYPPIDLVVVLVGANDLMLALAQGEHYQRPRPIGEADAEAAQLRSAFVFVPGRIHQPATDLLMLQDGAWFRSTALWQLGRRARIANAARTSPSLQDTSGDNPRLWRAARASGAVVHEMPRALPAALDEYRSNLEAMIAGAHMAGARILLVTQPSLWRPDNTPAEDARMWMGGIGDFPRTVATRYYSTEVLHAAMGLFNGVTLATCAAAGVDCVDAATGMPKDTTSLFDDVHFTEEGARQLAELLVERVRASPPFARGSVSAAWATPAR